MIFAKTKAPNKHRSGKVPILFFDSESWLCDSLLKYIYRHTKKGQLRFCTIHSTFASYIIEMHTDTHSELRSFYLLSDGMLYKKTDAVLKAIQIIPGIRIKEKIIKRISSILYVLNEYILFNRLFDCFYERLSKFLNKIMTRDICELQTAKYIEEENERFIS